MGLHCAKPRRIGADMRCPHALRVPLRERATTAVMGHTDLMGKAATLAAPVANAMVGAKSGSLVRKQPVPPSAGTMPTGTPLFAGLLVGVVVIVVGLTYFPVLALGPIVEQLSL